MLFNQLPRPFRSKRFRSWSAGYKVTCAGYNVGHALNTLRQTEELYNDIAADLQEGATFTPTAFDRVSLRYAGAKKQLQQAKEKAGLL